MNNNDGDNSYYWGLPKNEVFFSLIVVIVFLVYVLCTYPHWKMPELNTFIKQAGSIQLALVSALTLAWFYCYQLTKNINSFYLGLTWLAHSFYKTFNLNFGEENSILIDLISMVADLPLLLCSLSKEQRKTWLWCIPLITLILMSCIYNLGISENFLGLGIGKMVIIRVVSSIQPLVILFWLSYSSRVKNVFGVTEPLSRYLSAVFIALAFSQVPFLYEGLSHAKIENEQELILKVSTIIIFISMLVIAFRIASGRLRGIYEEKLLVEDQLNMKGEFETLGYLAASIEHELRNPLEVVKGELADLNERFQNQEELKKTFHSLELSVNRISVATDVINLLREDKEEFASNLKDTAVVDRLRQAVKFVKKELPIYADRVTIKITEHTQELFIMAFSQYLEKVFVNLLKNSFEAIDLMNKRGEVFIDIYLVDKHTIGITFRDTGAGFILADIPNLTKPDYTRKDKSPSKSNRGIGLFVCNKVVYLHNGTISFSNGEKGGAEVRLKFPRYFTKKMQKEQR